MWNNYLSARISLFNESISGRLLFFFHEVTAKNYKKDSETFCVGSQIVLVRTVRRIHRTTRIASSCEIHELKTFEHKNLLPQVGIEAHNITRLVYSIKWRWITATNASFSTKFKIKINLYTDMLFSSDEKMCDEEYVWCWRLIR